MSQKKIKLFVDADDTILKSSEAVIKILNKRHNIYPPKTYDDLADWGYNSIYPYMTSKDVFDIYESDEFFDIVEIDKDFLNFYKQNKEKIEIYIVTKGNFNNIQNKKIYFNQRIPDAKLIGCDLNFDAQSHSKDHIDMTNGIQIDDRCDCLVNTNAKIKILITHNKKFSWNNPKNYFIDNRYDCKDWKEISEILQFAIENEFFLED